MYRWLAANGNGLRAEIINAGREGIGTADVAAILEQEVFPLVPDHVIFYDGANQLSNARSLVTAAGRFKTLPSNKHCAGRRLLPTLWAARSRLVKVANDFIGSIWPPHCMTGDAPTMFSGFLPQSAKPIPILTTRTCRWASRAFELTSIP